MRNRTLRLALCVAGLLAGCRANPYQTSYTAASYKVTYPPVTHVRVLDVGGANPVDIYTRDFQSDALVGTSAWSGVEDIGDSCEAVAKKVGADLVLLSKVPAGTVQAQSSVLVPTQETTGYSGMVNTASGPRSYSGTSTTYGTQSVPMMVSLPCYEFRAVYVRTDYAK